MTKNIKKLAALSMAAIIAAVGFAGCGSTNNGDASSADDTSAATSEVKADFDTSKAITVVTREQGSGTRDAFIELTGVQTKDADGNKTDNTATSAVTVNSTAAVLTNIAGDDFAMGYISLGSLNDTVKALAVDGVDCTAENVKNGTYAIARPFNIATKGELSEVAQDFIDYILSADGQAVVEENGYIAVSDAEAYSGSKPSGKITVAGSSSVSPVMEKLKEAYLKVNTGAEIEIQTSDSSSGMTATMEGNCDIGMASRALKDKEAEQLTATQIAMDGIAVIVNNNNSIDNVTMEQIEKIYTGKTTSWAEIA